MRDELLKTRNLDLSSWVQICKAEEEAAIQIDKMIKTTHVLTIKKVNDKKTEQILMKSNGTNILRIHLTS